jgi:hypothetical protein
MARGKLFTAIYSFMDAVMLRALPVKHPEVHGHRPIVKLLLEQGADINSRDGRFGATPTGWAIEYLREMHGRLAIELDDLAEAFSLASRSERQQRNFV